jgi:hypothetical protein
MTFVKTKFGLPSVTRSDGTLGSYVPMNPRTSGQRFIWPAERIAIWQKQQAAAALQRKNTGAKPGPVQTSAALGAGPESTSAGAAGDVIGRAVQAAAASKAGPSAKDPNAPPAQPSNVVPYGIAIGSVVLAGGVLIALVKGMGRKVGKPIPGAHVYEGL